MSGSSRCFAVLADAIILKFHIDEILAEAEIRETQGSTLGQATKKTHKNGCLIGISLYIMVYEIIPT